MATGSARELLRGRRSIWLASWLASCFYIVTMLIILLSGSPAWRIPTGQIIACAIMVAVLCTHRKWRFPALLLGALQLALLVQWAHLDPSRQMYASVASAVAVWGAMLISNLLTILFAWTVFASHRYGSAAQASLFLLAYSAVHIGSGRAGDLIPVACAFVGACVVIWFARVGGSAQKLAILCIAVLLYTAAPYAAMAWRNEYTVPSLLIGVIYNFVTVALVWTYPYVIAPFVIDGIRRRRDRLTLAR